MTNARFQAAQETACSLQTAAFSLYFLYLGKGIPGILKIADN